MIAVLTDRAVVISLPHIDKYIEEPLHTEFNSDSYWTLNAYSTRARQQWVASKSVNTLVSTVLPATTRHIYHGQQTAYFFEICSNPAYFSKLYMHGLVSKRTIDNAIV